jgi:S-(hydroxymethyl)glutathione dehydrogenase/alcohol dehydrogenase
VRVRLAASGLCRTDLSCREGTIPVGVPSVPGHEGAGRVVALGEGVGGLSVGDPVVIAALPPCGGCFFCVGGQPNLCMTGLAAAWRPRFRLGDERVPASLGLGTFAEETVIPATAAIPIARDVPLDQAALLGCGVTTGLGAALCTARVAPGSSVVVIGGGGVGVAVLQGARIAGAAEIALVEPVARKRELGLRFGATHAVAPEGLGALVAELTEGRGFDYAFEVVGRAETIRAAWEATRRGGSTVIVGVPRAEETVCFSGFDLFYAEKRLTSSVYGGSDVRRDIGRWVRLWREGRLDLAGMITRRIDLAELDAAMSALDGSEGIRTLVVF